MEAPALHHKESAEKEEEIIQDLWGHYRGFQVIQETGSLVRLLLIQFPKSIWLIRAFFLNCGVETFSRLSVKTATFISLVY